ncbi:MlaD family protein [Beggiatoa leptomitoformis]|nr:MlaD family protein [Beggiatoa leptomitoformis]
MSKMTNDFPTATLKPHYRWTGPFLIPLIAVLIVGGLLYQTNQQQGVPLNLVFQQGYGIKVGDTLRYRGIEIGQVYHVRLSDDLQKVLVDIHLAPTAESIAREGSRFWIVRPQLDITGTSGLETVIGANYISVLPSNAETKQTHFVGLDMPLSITELETGGLEIFLQTKGKGILKRGAPIMYRQVAIGTILAVDLAQDGSTVVVQAYIKPEYTHLIRENTRFWKTSGMRLTAGWTGVDFQMDSVYSVIAGGISLAVPSNYGIAAKMNERFTLFDEPETEWLQWTAYIAPDKTLPNHLPKPLWAQLTWENTGMTRYTFWHETQQEGWILPITQGFLAPRNLLIPPENSQAVQLTINDLKIDLSKSTVIPYADGLAILPYTHTYEALTLPTENTHKTPEDSLVISSPTTPPHPLNAARYTARETTWIIQDKQAFSASWHGAPVVAMNNGELLGILIVEEKQAHVVLLTNNPTIEKGI